MKKIALACALLASGSILYAQSKKELQNEVSQLKAETQTLKREIEEADEFAINGQTQEGELWPWGVGGLQFETANWRLYTNRCDD